MGLSDARVGMAPFLLFLTISTRTVRLCDAGSTRPSCTLHVSVCSSVSRVFVSFRGVTEVACSGALGRRLRATGAGRIATLTFQTTRLLGFENFLAFCFLLLLFITFCFLDDSELCRVAASV